MVEGKDERLASRVTVARGDIAGAPFLGMHSADAAILIAAAWDAARAAASFY